jgi:hypothetical protein
MLPPKETPRRSAQPGPGSRLLLLPRLLLVLGTAQGRGAEGGQTRAGRVPAAGSTALLLLGLLLLLLLLLLLSLLLLSLLLLSLLLQGVLLLLLLLLLLRRRCGCKRRARRGARRPRSKHRHTCAGGPWRRHRHRRRLGHKGMLQQPRRAGAVTCHPGEWGNAPVGSCVTFDKRQRRRRGTIKPLAGVCQTMLWATSSGKAAAACGGTKVVLQHQHR